MNYFANCLLFSRSFRLVLALGKLLLKGSNLIPHKLPLSVELLKVIG